MKRLKWAGIVGLVLFLGAAIAGSVACKGGGKYADVKAVMEKQIELFEDYASDMDKAGSAGEVAAALNAFADKMGEIMPKLKEMEGKYPELKNSQTPPEELKPLVDKMGQVAGKIISASMKAAQYSQDPEVQKAQQRFQQTMTGSR